MCLYVKGGGGGGDCGGGCMVGTSASALKSTWLTCTTLLVGNLCVDMEIGLEGSG